MRFLTIKKMFPGCPATALLFICCMLASCRPPVAKHLDPVSFERWFTGAGASHDQGMRGVSTVGIDRLVDSLRHSGAAGRFTTVLDDTFGVSYSVGYQTPRSVRVDTLYPCIVYLHGGTGSMASNKGDSAFRMLGMLADSMELFLVSPSANRTTPWWSPAGLSRILQTLRLISLHYPVDPRRVFLAGVSDGATGCWAAANTIFAPFAGFIAVSGFGGMLPQLGMQLREVNLMQRPIYNVNAGHDRLYPLSAVVPFLDSMERAGVGVRRKVYADEEHGFDYRMKEAGTLCELLRTWTLPRGESFQAVISTTYPMCVDRCVSFECTAGAQESAIRGYCLNDTFFLHTSGLARLRMYFEKDDKCGADGLFKINSGKYRRCEPVVSGTEEVWLAMKQLCTPVVKNKEFYSITF